MANLTIQNLRVWAPASQHLLLDGISCVARDGEILAVVGPNGAGKSSLLHALAGDFESYQGTIDFGVIPHDLQRRARHMAVLPQFSLLSFPYRVDEVVRLGRIPHRSGQRIDQQIIDEVLHAMDIAYLAQRLYTELSGGEKQRVQLARVLAQIWRAEDADCGQRLLLLDEPTTALDLGHQHQLMQAIRKFAASGVIVVMVLHDLNLAARYADKVLALQCSQTLAFGSVSQVICSDVIQALYATGVAVLHHPDYSTPIVLGQ